MFEMAVALFLGWLAVSFICTAVVYSALVVASWSDDAMEDYHGQRSSYNE
jgi:hypothetical protein